MRKIGSNQGFKKGKWMPILSWCFSPEPRWARYARLEKKQLKKKIEENPTVRVTLLGNDILKTRCNIYKKRTVFYAVVKADIPPSLRSYLLRICKNASFLPDKEFAAPACLVGNRDILNEVVEGNPSLILLEKEKSKKRLLHYAAEGGNLSVLEYLLQRCAPSALLNQTDKGFTPLHLAVIHRRSEAVRLLAENSPPEAHHLQDNNGNSPLHIAAFRGYDNIAAFLAPYFHRPGLLNGYNCTPLNCAINRGEKSCMGGFFSSYLPDDPEIAEALKNNFTLPIHRKRKKLAYIIKCRNPLILYYLLQESDFLPLSVLPDEKKERCIRELEARFGEEGLDYFVSLLYETASEHIADEELQKVPERAGLLLEVQKFRTELVRNLADAPEGLYSGGPRTLGEFFYLLSINSFEGSRELASYRLTQEQFDKLWEAFFNMYTVEAIVEYVRSKLLKGLPSRTGAAETLVKAGVLRPLFSKKRKSGSGLPEASKKSRTE